MPRWDEPRPHFCKGGSMIGQTSLASLPALRTYKSHRISSWDTTGANTDAWRIEAGEKRVIGQIDGPAASSISG